MWILGDPNPYKQKEKIMHLFSFSFFVFGITGAIICMHNSVRYLISICIAMISAISLCCFPIIKTDDLRIEQADILIISILAALAINVGVGICVLANADCND